jgi:hypothetical protein
MTIEIICYDCGFLYQIKIDAPLKPVGIREKDHGKYTRSCPSCGAKNILKISLV